MPRQPLGDAPMTPAERQRRRRARVRQVPPFTGTGDAAREAARAHDLMPEFWDRTVGEVASRLFALELAGIWLDIPAEQTEVLQEMRSQVTALRRA